MNEASTLKVNLNLSNFQQKRNLILNFYIGTYSTNKLLWSYVRGPFRPKSPIFGPCPCSLTLLLKLQNTTFWYIKIRLNPEDQKLSELGEFLWMEARRNLCIIKFSNLESTLLCQIWLNNNFVNYKYFVTMQIIRLI